MGPQRQLSEQTREHLTSTAPFPRRIAILGSTGSIGRQTLDVIRSFPQHFTVVALAARNNVSLLAEQVEEFHPALVACTADTPEAETQLQQLLPQALRGMEGLEAVATYGDVDILVAATSGLIGLQPTLAAIRAGKTIALANKETLVMAGHLATASAEAAGVALLPVDSEHSAIWQCLRGESRAEVSKLIITASGGPFRKTPLEEQRQVTVAQALAHPTWNMGPKITIDSATLMNKGLEVIEAHWLFGLPYDQIEVVVHPQSIVHSMVAFVDGSIKMKASLPSMHLPIQVALSAPHRLNNADTGLVRPLRWPEVGSLQFEELDVQRFPCFRLAREAAVRGGSYPSVLVGADEEAVALFREGRIAFTQIAELIEQVLERHTPIANPDVDAILDVCAWAQQTCRELAASADLGVN
ncbi:MAG TPA: 1-deoxy-D-xylulose-5-phosphate reductoisomerase [Ktedonobacterales bacterium]|nr:1-deoxy-D-xylulose-5-phosphate reductoisomerase [Ktedonobacterales bacterium]